MSKPTYQETDSSEKEFVKLKIKERIQTLLIEKETAKMFELERRKKEQIAQIDELEKLNKKLENTCNKMQEYYEKGIPVKNFDEFQAIKEEMKQKKKQWRKTAKEHYRIMDELRK